MGLGWRKCLTDPLVGKPIQCFRRLRSAGEENFRFVQALAASDLRYMLTRRADGSSFLVDQRGQHVAVVAGDHI